MRLPQNIKRLHALPASGGCAVPCGIATSLSHTGRALSGISDFGLSESPPCAAIWAVLMRLCAVGFSTAVVASVRPYYEQRPAAQE